MDGALQRFARNVHLALSFRPTWRLLSALADLRLPKPLLDVLIGAYCKAFEVDLSEAEVPEGGFETFNAFFTRRLVPGSRPLTSDELALISPCDGTISSAGRISEGELIQAKGRKYSLGAFLGDSSLARRLEGGLYVTIYLSPRDYHRVHFPCDAVVRAHDYQPGRTFSVAPFPLESFDDVYVRNERLHVFAESERFGFFVVSMVGAAGVSRITLSHPQMAQRWASRQRGRVHYEPPVRVKRGQELGMFNLGSTVVVLTEPGPWEDELPTPGSKTKLGQVLLRIRKERKDR